MLQLTAKHCSVSFTQPDGGRTQSVFAPVDFTLKDNVIFSIQGSNGAGKSTLLKIILQILRPTTGSIECHLDSKKLNGEEIRSIAGFSAPYMHLYEEFSPVELCQLDSNLKSKVLDLDRMNHLLSKVGLYHRKDDTIKRFSSGMKQRMKVVLSALHSPKIMILDEPTSNLDDTGVQAVHDIITMINSEGSMIILATNDQRDSVLSSASLHLSGN
jgi:ABC-type multidrug transport system ATPase subunit